MTKAHFETDRHMSGQFYYCPYLHMCDVNKRPVNKKEILCVYVSKPRSGAGFQLFVSVFQTHGCVIGKRHVIVCEYKMSIYQTYQVSDLYGKTQDYI